MLHVARPDWLGLVVQRATQDVLWVFHVHAWAVLALSGVGLGVSDHLWIWHWHHVIHLGVWLHEMLSITVALAIQWLLEVFLVGQAKPSHAIGQSHFDVSWGKVLRRLLLKPSDLFFRMTHWSIMFLRILLHQWILERLLVNEFLLSIAGNSRLAWVDRALDGGDHVQEVVIVLCVSNVIEPRMLQSLLAGHSISRVHLK